MEQIISFRRWFQVLCCFAPEVFPEAADAYSCLVMHFNKLYSAYPGPPFAHEVWNLFNEPRDGAILAMVRLLADVGRAGLSSPLLSSRMLHGSDESEYARLMAIAFECETNRWREICPREKRFELKTWEAVAFWANDPGQSCRICKLLLEDKCLQCQADQAMVGCPIVWGVCSHGFHFHCAHEWLEEHNTCPVDMLEWACYGYDY